MLWRNIFIISYKTHLAYSWLLAYVLWSVDSSDSAEIAIFRDFCVVWALELSIFSVSRFTIWFLTWICQSPSWVDQSLHLWMQSPEGVPPYSFPLVTSDDESDHGLSSNPSLMRRVFREREWVLCSIVKDYGKYYSYERAFEKTYRTERENTKYFTGTN